MSIQFFEKKTLVKKTKPKTSVLVSATGFVDDETGAIIDYATFFADFIDKYVTLTVTETSQEDLTDAEKSNESDEV